MQQENAPKLQEFVEASKSKGASDEFLVAFLTRRGWPQDDVYAALGNYWERVTGLTVPGRAAAGESSRDAFLYLLSFCTLATWSTALGSMLFRFIERWFPDPVAHLTRYDARLAITWQMASVAVAFPIFLIVTWAILREAQQQPERLQSGVRKWLTYIALLLTAGGMICDLIWFLDFFLVGELTSRFVLKSLTVMLICGAIFVYYLGSLRWDRNTDVNKAKTRSLLFAIAAGVAVITTFCIGLAVAGSPTEQRHLEADRTRVQNLRQIAYAIYDWRIRAGANKSSVSLPGTLTELVGNGIGPTQIADPETGVPYEYRIKPDSIYELCAGFTNADSADPQFVTGIWHHGKGRTCFSVDSKQRHW
jgi:uncharacterized membrane protein YidH (DUF202 family)